MSGGVPAGWALVPVEPTEAMLDASWKQTGESKEMRARTHAHYRRHYAAMLAATPTPPPSRDADVERAIARLRSAKDSFDVIGRGAPHLSAVQEIARAESEQIAAALQVLGERG